MTHSNLFLKNMAWLGSGEAFVRVTRLLTAVVLARYLDPVTFGVAALVLTINELVMVFNRNGVAAKIVECDESELDNVCETSYRIGFVFCLGLFILQSLLAYPLASYFQNADLVLMVQALALVYLIMPFALVQSALVQREENLRLKAFIESSQVGVDNFITAGLAIAGFGAWAIVLPKLLVSPIWVLGYRKARHWQPREAFWFFNGWREIVQFGRYFLGIEILKTARLNIDNLLIAKFLGVEALGLYYFARNAGLGFSLSLISALCGAMFPSLCKLKNDLPTLNEVYKGNLKRALLITTPFILTQASLAFWYVPLVFGDQWNLAIPVLSMLCLSALFRPLAESASMLSHATGQIKQDFVWNLFFTLTFLMLIVLVVPFGLLEVSVTIAVLYGLSQPLYAIYVYKKTFARDMTELKPQEFLS